MSLKELQFPKSLVKTPAGDFAVRGLSLQDFVNLYNLYTEQFGDLFSQFKDWSTTDGDDLPPLDQFVTKLVLQCPTMAAHAIVIAADDDPNDKQALAAACRLDSLSQAEALKQIGVLTFRTEDEVKKMLGLAISAMHKMTDALLQMAEPTLRNPGSGQSGNP